MSNIVTRDSIGVVFDDVTETLICKNTDYGNVWEKNGVVGLLVRLGDKLTRLETISNRRALVADETVRDTLVDIIGYATLAILAIDNGYE